MGRLAHRSLQPYRTLIGRRTFEALSDVPEAYRDDDYRHMIENPGWVISSTLGRPGWPRLTVLGPDFLDTIRKAREAGGPEIRTMGSLSIVRQLLAATLLDRLRLIYCPLILPQSGLEPFFHGMLDQKFELMDHRLPDREILVLDYGPAGWPLCA